MPAANRIQETDQQKIDRLWLEAQEYADRGFMSMARLRMDEIDNIKDEIAAKKPSFIGIDYADRKSFLCFYSAAIGKDGKLSIKYPVYFDV